jgi:ribosomal protein L11 methyltransferase
MKWMEVTVRFEASGSEPAADLIADIFYEIGVKGVVIEDPDLKTTEPLGRGGIKRPAQHAVIGYLPVNHRLHANLAVLQRRLNRYQTEQGIVARIDFKTLDEEDWAQAWKTFFKPIRVAENIIVKPSWEAFDPAPGDLVIEIDPGMAFGTGSHPSTTLCIELIQRYLNRGDHFLDIGIGSGILSLAAAKLGAGRIVGVDADAGALTVSKENLRRNKISEDLALLVCGNLVDAVDAHFDLVAANILSEVILKILTGLARVLKPGGTFICSGIALENQRKVIDAIKQQSMQLLEVCTKEDWAAIAVRRRQ